MWKFFLFFHYFILHSSYQVPLLPQEKRYTQRPPPLTPPSPRSSASCSCAGHQVGSLSLRLCTMAPCPQHQRLTSDSVHDSSCELLILLACQVDRVLVAVVVAVAAGEHWDNYSSGGDLLSV